MKRKSKGFIEWGLAAFWLLGIVLVGDVVSANAKSKTAEAEPQAVVAQK